MVVRHTLKFLPHRNLESSWLAFSPFALRFLGPRVFSSIGAPTSRIYVGWDPLLCFHATSAYLPHTRRIHSGCPTSTVIHPRHAPRVGFLPLQHFLGYGNPFIHQLAPASEKLCLASRKSDPRVWLPSRSVPFHSLWELLSAPNTLGVTTLQSFSPPSR